jgi:hypothetical protein
VNKKKLQKQGQTQKKEYRVALLARTAIDKGALLLSDKGLVLVKRTKVIARRCGRA